MGEAAEDELKDPTNYVPGGKAVDGVQAGIGLIMGLIRRIPDAADAAGDVLRAAAKNADEVAKAAEAAERAKKAAAFTLDGPTLRTILETAKETSGKRGCPMRVTNKLVDKAKDSPLWGPVPNKLGDKNRWALAHLREILRGPGDWKPMLDDVGNLGPHMVKYLPDGRGVAISLDGKFITFLFPGGRR